jgi:hypothetical protein
MSGNDWGALIFFGAIFFALYGIADELWLNPDRYDSSPSNLDDYYYYQGEAADERYGP